MAALDLSLTRSPSDWGAFARTKLDAAKVRRGLKTGAEAAGRLLQYDLMSRAPKKTGRFASSIRAKVAATGRGYKVTFTAADPPARFLLEGTRAHGPVSAQALRFEIDGRVIFAKWVRGIKPNHFDLEVGRANAEAVHAIFQAGVMSALGL